MVELNLNPLVTGLNNGTLNLDEAGWRAQQVAGNIPSSLTFTYVASLDGDGKNVSTLDLKKMAGNDFVLSAREIETQFKANDDFLLKNVPLWFAALDGKTMAVGATSKDSLLTLDEFAGSNKKETYTETHSYETGGKHSQTVVYQDSHEKDVLVHDAALKTAFGQGDENKDGRLSYDEYAGAMAARYGISDMPTAPAATTAAASVATL